MQCAGKYKRHDTCEMVKIRETHTREVWQCPTCDYKAEIVKGREGNWLGEYVEREPEWPEILGPPLIALWFVCGPIMLLIFGPVLHVTWAWICGGVVTGLTVLLAAVSLAVSLLAKLRG